MSNDLKDFFDSNAGGFAPAFKFTNIGDTAIGTITRLAVRDSKDLVTGETMKNLVIGVQPEQGDEYSVWIKASQMLSALQTALMEAGIKATEMAEGDQIAVEFFDTKATKLSPQKLFRVKYRPQVKAAGISLNDL